MIDKVKYSIGMIFHMIDKVKYSIGMIFHMITNITKFIFSKSNNPDFIDWVENGFLSPPPRIVKQEVLRRRGGKNTWIETGTFLGDTSYFLSTFASKVFTIEPDDKLYQMALARFENNVVVNCVKGTSEEKLQTIIDGLSPESLSDLTFWLDGHYSGGITYQSVRDTPIEMELACIQKILNRTKKITILIDDVRCFGSDLYEYKDYPNLEYLVNWSAGNRLYWTIEQDIFVASNVILQ
jgi:hypothetical protein